MTDYLSPHWDASALVVVDLQRDFLDGGPAPIPGTSAVVPTVVALAREFRLAGRPVIHLVRLYRPDGSDVDLARRDAVERGVQIVAPGSDGSQVAEGVLPQQVRLDAEALLAGRAQHVGQTESVLFKPRWSGFHRTELERRLRGSGCDTVTVVGCNLPNCPRATLFDASERDFRTVLASDAVSQVTQERLADLERIGVSVLTSAQVGRGLRTVEEGRRPW